MLLLDLVILAQSRGEQEPPDTGVGIGLIIGALLFAALVAFALFTILHKRSRASKGGVEAPPSETGQAHPGQPPVESVEPRS